MCCPCFVYRLIGTQQLMSLLLVYRFNKILCVQVLLLTLKYIADFLLTNQKLVFSSKNSPPLRNLTHPERMSLLLSLGSQVFNFFSPSLEAKPTVATPQEDFDTSTYKNLQHHEYTPFTFVDFDVELSKFRLAQPSSGRISPRH